MTYQLPREYAVTPSGVLLPTLKELTPFMHPNGEFPGPLELETVEERNEARRILRELFVLLELESDWRFNPARCAAR